MFGSLDISASALVAQRTRMDVIANNLANMDSTTDAAGHNVPFRRRIAVFTPGDPSAGRERGVHVSQIALDPSPFRQVYSPGDPNADEQGYIKAPNIDPTYEMVSAIEASRAYEANITAAEATKSMISESLRLLA